MGRFLPLVIGHKIPEGNEHWQNFLRLLDIMDILFARQIPEEECGYLEVLICCMHMYICQNRAFPRICCGEPFSFLLEIHRKIDKEFVQVLHELHAAKCLLHFIPPTCSAN